MHLCTRIALHFIAVKYNQQTAFLVCTVVGQGFQ